MPKPSKKIFERENRPSPLSTVQYARPLSTMSSMNNSGNNVHDPLAGDPRRLSVLPEQMAGGDQEFWQRFEVAARNAGMDEESMNRPETPDSIMPPAASDKATEEEWTTKQKKKRRRTHLIVASAAITIAALIIIIGIVGWWFSQGPGKR